MQGLLLLQTGKQEEGWNFYVLLREVLRRQKGAGVNLQQEWLVRPKSKSHSRS
ncbi:hypothetical protein L915_13186 [Phytophthora nicotianae]|uniref:Uncharacterized protein n=1 Tax=Phytophthora nicotianae TaxID=4792 RepID=W2GEF3_PHYNI|nr:hypothetical protein L915_13186 [Phytophthora nicotianae]